jgi:uncharacterized membrane protein (TIGR02234 family)
VTRIAQGLLLLAALALWVGSRSTWVEVASADGLGQPKTTALSGATWSEALVPLALLALAATVAVLAVRGWPLRLLAAFVALSSAAMAYLAIGQWAIPDVGVRAAELAQVPVAALVGVRRFYWGATFTLLAAVATLVAAVLLIRAATRAGAGATAATTTKYAAPAVRRAAARTDETSDAMSERQIWDALDEGHDPTGGVERAGGETDDTEGR